MFRRSRTLVFGLVLALVAPVAPAHAARPLLDYHRLDAYFAMYARDASVPWEPAAVRLDTYTSAPLSFAVYQVDPADVIVAGSNTRPRAIDTRHLHAIARWTYAPPGGYRFQSNDVGVPLGSREGFFVVEARRGNVGEQVWIDRTRIGLLTKETPAGIQIYGADLGTGKPLAHMRVSFIVHNRFVDRYTGRSGLLAWRSVPRPVFAMAQWAASSAFVSFLPQAPLPQTIVGVTTDTAVVHAGDVLRVVGFARSRSGGRLRPSAGTAAVTLRAGSELAAQTSVRLDAAGAFSAPLRVPQNGSSGAYTLMATVNHATAATAVHVDANAAGVSLTLATQCPGECDPQADIPLRVRAMREGVPAAGIPVSVKVIRSPHVHSGVADGTPWGVARWFSATVTTGIDGSANLRIPHPADGLPSTYGVRAASGGATADTRIVVPTSRIALQLHLARDDVGSAQPAAFDVFAFEAATGKPVGHIPVRVQLVHGSSVQEQTLTLDDAGRARGVFSAPQTGSNLLVAASANGEAAMDAAQLQVESQTMQTQSTGSENVRVSLDRVRYDAGQIARVDAFAAGAQGDALVTLESASGTQACVVVVNGGRASASLVLADSPGVLAIGAAFVRDGAIEWDTVPLVIDAPGRPLAAPLQLDRSAYAAGATARVQLGEIRPGQGTLVVRITKGAPSGSALFTNAPDLLAIGTTATQDTAVAGASWHPWVDSTGEHPMMQSFARRSAPPDDLAMTQADSASVYWKIDRSAGDSVVLPVPRTPGRYVLSLLKIGDDGRVAAASGDLVVQ